MKVSTRGDYASRALLSLSLHEGEGPTSVRDIAERTGLPQPYLEQILLALKGAGLVRSKRGVGGGYVLARQPEEINLAQIISAVDGPIREMPLRRFISNFIILLFRINLHEDKPTFLHDMEMGVFK